MNIMDFDALTVTSIVSRVLSSSKQDLLLCLSSMQCSDLKHLLLIFLKQLDHPFMDQLIDQNWHNVKQKDRECISNIKDFITNQHEIPSSENTERDCKFIQMIPSSIAGYILSFSNMKDVLQCSLVCKSFYKYSQIPMATHHLIIDHSFVKGLYHKTLNHRKYSNIKYLTINYVFCNSSVQSNKYHGFETRYYSAIVDILLKSPELHTLEYNLTYKRFKYNLHEKVGDSSAGTVGHLLEWVSSVIEHCTDRLRFRFFGSISPFLGLTKLIWTPSQPHAYYGWQSHIQNEHALFKHYFPKLHTLTLSKVKLYKQNHWGPPSFDHGNRDLEWFMFKKDYFYDTLRHINANMVPEYTRSQTRWGTLNHVNIDNNPIYYFYQFRNLQYLELKLPIFDECDSYYNQLWTDALMQTYLNAYCLEMKVLKLNFEWTDVNHFTGRMNNVAQTNYGLVIDHICEYILSRCPNVIHFDINTNAIIEHNPSDHTFNCLIGHYGKLQVLSTDYLRICEENTRLLSLRKLVFTTNAFIDNGTETVNFDLFPNLESLQVIHDNDRDQNDLDLNGNIISFLKCIRSNQQYLKHLKYISLSHSPWPKKRTPNRYRFRNIKDSGKEICRLITWLTTNNDIKTVELNPVAIQQNGIDYLSFWFSAQFGSFRIEHVSNKTKYCICSVS